MEYIHAFWVGGLVCALVQILLDRTELMSGRSHASCWSAPVRPLGFLGIYEPSKAFAGAGAGVASSRALETPFIRGYEKLCD